MSTQLGQVLRDLLHVEYIDEYDMENGKVCIRLAEDLAIKSQFVEDLSGDEDDEMYLDPQSLSADLIEHQLLCRTLYDLIQSEPQAEEKLGSQKQQELFVQTFDKYSATVKSYMDGENKTKGGDGVDCGVDMSNNIEQVDIDSVDASGAVGKLFD